MSASLRRFISHLAFVQDANIVLHAAGYTEGEDGIMRKRDLNRVNDAIRYGVSPDEFACTILERDGYRTPMTSAHAGSLS